MAKLGDVCVSITDGSHNPPAGVEQSPFIMLSSKNIEDNYISLASPRYLSEPDYANENKRTKISAGDLLVTIVGTIGRVAIVPPALAGICVQRSVAVLKTNPDIIDNRFLMYQLQNMRPCLEREAKGVAQKGIYLKQLSSLTVSTPSMEEQKRIAAVLDKVTDLIAQRRAQLDKLDLLVKSRFVEMFGDPIDNSHSWDTIKLKDIGTCKNGMNFHTDDFGVKIHCLGVADFKDYSFIGGTSQLSVISLNERPTEEYLLKNNDIVFVRSNGNKALVGRSVLVYPGTTPTTFSGFCIRFRLQSESIRPVYLLRVLKTDSVRKKLVGRGANIQNLNQKLLLELSIPVPPLELQDSFENFEKRIVQLRAPVSQSLNRLEMLKNSLMQQYFG